MRLTHRMIEVFRTLVLTGNATRSAELLFTSQPSISRDLARLEQVTGIALFERRAGRLYPTAQALALYHEVERSFIGLNSIAARAENLRTLGEGQIHIAALPVLSDTLLPQACKLFADRHPAVSIRLVSLESPELEATIAAQQVDIGLIEQLDSLPETDSELLFEGDEKVLLPSAHPLTKKQKLTPQDFSGLPFVSFAPQDAYRKRIDEVFREHGVQRKLVIETSTASSVCALVEQGIGLAIVNPFTAAQAQRRGISIKPFTVSIPYRVALARPRRRPASPLIDLFAETVRQCL